MFRADLDFVGEMEDNLVGFCSEDWMDLPVEKEEKMLYHPRG